MQDKEEKRKVLISNIQGRRYDLILLEVVDTKL